MIHKWKDLYQNHLTLYVRVMCGLIAISLTIFAYDLVLSPFSPALGAPVFEVVRAMMPLNTWGLLFLLSALLFSTAAISGRFVIYAAALALGVGLQVAWFGGVLAARFFQDAPLSSAGIGLWVLALSLTAGTAFIPQTIEEANTHVVLVDENDNKVVELRRSG